jgi:DNA-binding GntR family transcriptional regulator
MQNIVDATEKSGRIGRHGEDFRRLDAAFHLALIRETGNRQLLETVVALQRKCEIKAGGAASEAGLVSHVFATEPIDSIRRTCREHDRLIELLEDGRGEKEAGELMKRHISEGRRLALSAFDQSYMGSPLHMARHNTRT